MASRQFPPRCRAPPLWWRVISLETPTRTDDCATSAAADRRAQRRRIVNENLPTIVHEKKKKKNTEGSNEQNLSLNRAIRLSITVATVLRNDRRRKIGHFDVSVAIHSFSNLLIETGPLESLRPSCDRNPNPPNSRHTWSNNK